MDGGYPQSWPRHVHGDVLRAGAFWGVFSCFQVLSLLQFTSFLGLKMCWSSGSSGGLLGLRRVKLMGFGYSHEMVIGALLRT